MHDDNQGEVFSVEVTKKGNKEYSVVGICTNKHGAVLRFDYVRASYQEANDLAHALFEKIKADLKFDELQ